MKVSAKVMGKPESFNAQGAPFGYEELFQEVDGPRKYPIFPNFGCSHSHPMITLAQRARIALIAKTR